ncbi:hypothetical protein [Aquimarina spongiae]|uniref:Uncharacterized protein n=1 Tax=Aquimarina spongiae TaxID=570521 RepID=A0A1M6BB67_9FLAO|nr:hypothetical protein [Aquimarina spongiae]SHI45808.1 hypothetical protein SAMN04488508_101717 [Aquimarina spongiae]
MKHQQKGLKGFEQFALKSISARKVTGGQTATDDLAKWRKNIEDGMIDRR